MQSVLISIEVFTQPNCTHFTVIYSVKNTDCIEEGTVWVKVLLSFCNATCNVQIYQRLVQRKTLEINCIPYLTANFAPLRRLIKVDASKREPLVMEVAQWCTGTLIASCGWWVSPALDLCCSDFSASLSLHCSPMLPISLASFIQNATCLVIQRQSHFFSQPPPTRGHWLCIPVANWGPLESASDGISGEQCLLPCPKGTPRVGVQGTIVHSMLLFLCRALSNGATMKSLATVTICAYHVMALMTQNS